MDFYSQFFGCSCQVCSADHGKLFTEQAFSDSFSTFIDFLGIISGGRGHLSMNASSRLGLVAVNSARPYKVIGELEPGLVVVVDDRRLHILTGLW